MKSLLDPRLDSNVKPWERNTAAALSPEQAQDFQKEWGPVLGAELQSLSRERDPELYHAGLLHLASRLQDRGMPEGALSLYAIVSAQQEFPDLSRRAQASLEALEGRGEIGARAEVLLSRFAQEATDPALILPMLAGTAVAGLVRGAGLGQLAASPAAWYSRGWGARLGAGSLAYAAEVPTFVAAGRAWRGLQGGPQAGWGQDFASGAITLGAIKLFGLAGKQGLAQLHGVNEFGILTRGATLAKYSHPLIGQVALFGGLMSAHGVEAKLGLRPQVNGATAVADTLGAMLSLGAGARLGRGLLGRGYAAKMHELEWRTQSLTRAVTLPNADLSALSAKTPGGKREILGSSLSGRRWAVAATAALGVSFDQLPAAWAAMDPVLKGNESSPLGLITGLSTFVLGMAISKKGGKGSETKNIPSTSETTLSFETDSLSVSEGGDLLLKPDPLTNFEQVIRGALEQSRNLFKKETIFIVDTQHWPNPLAVTRETRVFLQTMARHYQIPIRLFWGKSSHTSYSPKGHLLEELKSIPANIDQDLLQKIFQMAEFDQHPAIFTMDHGEKITKPVLFLMEKKPELLPLLIRLLGHIRDSQTAPLIQSYLGHENLQVRRRAAQALGGMRVSHAIEDLWKLALDDAAGWGSREAFAALGQIGNWEMVPRLLALFQEDGWFLRFGAARALSYYAIPMAYLDSTFHQDRWKRLLADDITPALEARLRDPHHKVLAEAARALGKLNVQSSRPKLEALRSYPNKYIQAQAAAALADLNKQRDKR